MQTQTVTLIVAGVGVGGVLVGHYLTRSWQHEQWIRDKRHQDFQDVLSAVTAAYMAMIRLNGMVGTPGSTRELAEETARVKLESFRILRDRIFIAHDLRYQDILGQWDAAVTNFENNAVDDVTFAKRFNELNGTLVNMALRPPYTPWWFKRWSDRRKMANFERKFSPSRKA